MDGLREIVGTMALAFGRRMLLGRWSDGQADSYMIAMEGAPFARSPAFEPIVMALPDGAFLPIGGGGPDRPLPGAASPESLPMPDNPPPAGAGDPLEAVAAQFDLGLRVASGSLAGAASAWHLLFRSYVDLGEATRRAYGGLLLDWHEKVLGSSGR